MVERKTIIGSKESFFHLLRHFSSVSDDEFAYFIQEGYTKFEIEKELSFIGSKFAFNFAKGPLDLLKILNSFTPQTTFMQSEDVCVLIWDMNNFGYDKPIGFDGIVSISNLNEAERKKIYKVNRGNFSVYSYTSDVLLPTLQVVLIATEQEGCLRMKTAFSGTYAPPFPSEWMNEFQKGNAQEFWDTHAFIVVDSNTLK